MTTPDTRTRKVVRASGVLFMESVLAAAITGFLTLIGVLVSNSRSRAVMEVKLDTLSERVQKHNEVIARTYRLEQDMAVAQNDIETLYRKVG